MTSVAFIGLGAMGGRMAARLLGAGHDLVVFNRTRGRTVALAEAGARVAETPAEAVREAEVLITMVADPLALRAVTEGPDGVAAGIGSGSTAIDMSTVGPTEVQRLAQALPSGAGLLDAPVLGSIAEAEAGTLRVFLGGPRALAERYTALLATFGAVSYVGPLGAGAAAKLVANSTLFGALGVLGEAVALGTGLGLSQSAIADVLAVTPLADQAQRRRGVLASERAPPPRFSLSLASKDADLVVAAAVNNGLDLRLAPAVARWLAQAQSAGHGPADYSWVLKTIVEARAGPTETCPVAAAGCDSWRLLERDDLAVAEERMPPDTTETPHVHRRARQFFFILDGRAVMHLDDQDVELDAGGGIEIAPGVRHAIANTSAQAVRFVVISSPTTRGDRTERSHD